MTSALPKADQDLLQKLLLGQLTDAEADRLAAEYSDDSRLAELAESLPGRDDPVLELLRNYKVAALDDEGERLIARLLQRLQVAPPVGPRDETAVLTGAEVSTHPGVPAVAKQTPLPARLEYYQPIKILGQGGMGTVFLALDTRLGREVAIKTVRPELAANPEAKERFLREARTAASIEHDNIAAIYYVGEADGTPFLAMPLLKGEPLDAVLRRTDGPLSVALAVRLAREAASGLAAAHERGLIHRDIKPANIWLEAPGGRTKILDFGLAKAAGVGSDADPNISQTASGMIVGTPSYMAPEQASGRNVDARADLFSLGCVLYEMLAGQRSFPGASTMAILSSLALHTPPAPHTLNPRCPVALSRLVMRLLEKDPDNRVASPQEVIKVVDEMDVSSFDPECTIVTRPPPAVSPPRTAPLRLRVAVLAAVGMLALVVVGLLFGGQIIRIVTNQGQIIIETDAEGIEVILKDGEGTVIDTKTKRQFTFKAGEYNIEVTVKDAGGEQRFVTDHFRLTRNGKTTIDARWEVAKEKPAAESADAERRVAEWVLRNGGQLALSAGERYLGSDWKLGALPGEPFQVYWISLTAKPVVDDKILDTFRDLRGLERLSLHGQPITDAGLASFLASPGAVNLRTIGIMQDNITDAGFEPLANLRSCFSIAIRCPNITNATVLRFRDLPVTEIDLHSGLVTGEGFAALKGKKLTSLSFSCPKVDDRGMEFIKETTTLISLGTFGGEISDAGLTHLASNADLVTLGLDFSKVSAGGIDRIAGFRKLIELNLRGLPVSDKDLEKLHTLPELKVLRLAGSKVTDGGMIHLKGMKLSDLNLNDLPISDHGLQELKAITTLTALYLDGTKVTDAGVKNLSAALPSCRIKWNGGVIEPQTSRAGASSLDALDPAKIPAAERFPWQPKELVAVIGEHRQRHWGAVTCIAIRSDGKQVASGGRDGQIRFWDTATRRELQGVSLGCPIDSLAYSADGKRLASGSGNQVQLWDVSAAKPKRDTVVSEDVSSVLYLAFAPGGKTLVYNCARGNEKIGGVWLWDLSQARPRLRARFASADSASISPDGASLAVVHSEDRSIRIYDLSQTEPKERAMLPGKEGKARVHTSEWPPLFAPDGRLAAHDPEQTLRFWDISGKEPRVDAVIKQHGPSNIAFSADGKRMATGTAHEVQLWEKDDAGYVLMSGVLAKREGFWDFGPLALSPTVRL